MTARLRSCDEDRLADYDRSILSTLSALTGYFGVPLPYPPLKELAPFLDTKPRHVMLLLLDGMGGYPLRTILPETSYLRAHEIATVTSIFPPTTAAATTAYYCGQSALESGWLGWHLYMKEFASDVIAFKRADYYTGHVLTGPFPAGELIPYETVFERMQGVCGTHTLYALRFLLRAWGGLPPPRVLVRGRSANAENDLARR